MKRLAAMFVALGSLMLFSTAAQAVPEASSNGLLASFSSSDGGAMAPMSTAELGAVRGEGILEKFFAVPQLARSFEKTFTFDTTTISIVGVAGEGITLFIDSPFIP